MRRMTSRWVFVGSVACAFVAAWRTEMCDARSSGRGRAHLRRDMVDSVQVLVPTGVLFSMSSSLCRRCMFSFVSPVSTPATFEAVPSS
jgi:hypothetical protein